MGWSVGYSEQHKRYVGYGVPANCEYPTCRRVIDRGLSYICGASVGGGEHGCGMFFCHKHLLLNEKAQLCERCLEGKTCFPLKPERKEWLRHLLKDESWQEWRDRNPKLVKKYRRIVAHREQR